MHGHAPRARITDTGRRNVTPVSFRSRRPLTNRALFDVADFAERGRPAPRQSAPGDRLTPASSPCGSSCSRYHRPLLPCSFRQPEGSKRCFVSLLLVREFGRSKPDYSLLFDLPQLPAVG